VKPVFVHNVEALYLLFAVPLMVALYLYAGRRRHGALRNFTAPERLATLTDPATRTRRRWHAVASCVAFASVVVALARPAWNHVPQTVERRGRDIVFVLDVSKSMLAQDVLPSRLERAKTAILDCIESLQGDRVALVAFAGSASVLCPLTLDYAFFRMRLDEVGPDSVIQGGTRIGDAIDITVNDLLDYRKAGYQDIILITDGEDHGSSPADAAGQLSRIGARLIAIGIGDATHGGRIPMPVEAAGRFSFMKHDNREVWTRFEAGTLRRMVNATPDGVYIEVGTGAVDLADVYRELIRSAQVNQLDQQTRLRYEEKFQVFLAAAFAVLFLAAIPGERRTPGPAKRIAPMVGIMLFALAMESASAASYRELVTRGNQAYNSGDYTAACTLYQEALSKKPTDYLLHYNLGNTLYRQGEYAAAIEPFENAAFLSRDAAFQARCWHNLGNSLFRDAETWRETDKNAANHLCELSERYYRAALDLDPERKDSAHNIEVARLTAKAIADEIRAAEDAKKQFERALAEIRKKLVELIKRQQTAATACANLDPAGSPDEYIERLTGEQEVIRDETVRLADRMKELDARLPKMPQFSEDGATLFRSPLEVSRKHVLNAIGAQNRAVDDLAKPKFDSAHAAQQMAVRELELALRAIPATSREGEEGVGEEQEGEFEESDEQRRDGTRRPFEYELADSDLDDEVFTAPKTSPHDIIEEERRNSRVRARKRPGSYVAVDKDW